MSTIEDLEELIPGNYRKFFGGAPGVVTWFDEGAWHVSGARQDVADRFLRPFDPEAPWRDDGLEWGLSELSLR